MKKQQLFHFLRAPQPIMLLLALLSTANCVPKEGCASASSAKISPQVLEQPKKETKWSSLPALSMSGLSAQQKEAFLQFANEEICPCDCPKSLAGCLQTPEQCQPAVVLAQWAIENMRQGVPFDIMVEPLAKEIGLGFSAKPQIIDLASYHSKGASQPLMTLVEFADFECAHCKTTAVALNTLVKKYPNEIRLVYKHYPLPAHPMSKVAAIASEAAGQQGKFWEMHEGLFASEQPLSEKQILTIAKRIGFLPKQLTQFQADIKSSKVTEKVDNSMKEAQMLGLEGTPTIFFNGRPYFLSLDVSGLEMRIFMEKMRSAATCK